VFEYTIIIMIGDIK
jgi:hypothetical protein